MRVSQSLIIKKMKKNDRLVYNYTHTQINPFRFTQFVKFNTH